MRKGSLEVTFFRMYVCSYVRPSVRRFWEIHFFGELELWCLIWPPMVPKWTGSEPEVDWKWPEVGQKWTGSVHPSVCTSVHPKHFPYPLDKPYARDLQAQGACALRFLKEFKTAILLRFGPLSKKDWLELVGLFSQFRPCLLRFCLALILLCYICNYYYF